MSRELWISFRRVSRSVVDAAGWGSVMLTKSQMQVAVKLLVMVFFSTFPFSGTLRFKGSLSIRHPPHGHSSAVMLQELLEAGVPMMRVFFPFDDQRSSKVCDWCAGYGGGDFGVADAVGDSFERTARANVPGD